MFTSGTQALQGRTVNHDPLPIKWYEGCRYSANMPKPPGAWLDPRPEYAVLDNPILADFRRLMDGIIQTGGSGTKSPAQAEWWLVLLSDENPLARAHSGFDYHITDEQLRHAIRVLTLLVALGRDE